MQLRLQLLFVAVIVAFCVTLSTGEGKSSEAKKKKNEKTQSLHKLPKEVIVIGAGLAGLAAARRIASDRTNFTVEVYEARKDRFGGRVWTDKLFNPKAKGPEVDLGGSALNVVAKNNPLVELAESFDLKVVSISNPQFIVPWEKKAYSGDDFKDITHQAAQILGQAVNNSRSTKIEVSMKTALDEVIQKGYIAKSNSPAAQLVKCLPSYVLENYSTRHYSPEALDVGYDKVLVDGMGELTDRLLSGSTEEAPLHLNLNKAVRQVKVDKTKGKVKVRFRDGSQTQGDIVVVTVPSTIISTGELLFEPDLPKKYHLAASEISMSAGDKVIVEFEQAFWPAEFESFLRAVKKDSDRGNLQTWVNLKSIVNKPALTGLLFGEAATAFEKLSDEEAQETVLKVLNEMFSEETVKQGGKIVRMQRSQWVSDPWSRGASTYPRVGSDPNWWNTFADPVCPYIYFAGEHTSFEGHGTLHGAYNSGIRAADQLLTGLCEKLHQEEERRKEAERRKKKNGNKTKPVDDEELENDVVDSEEVVVDEEIETADKEDKQEQKENRKTEL